MLNSVIINIARGEALIGGVAVPVSGASRHGELRVAGSNALLRPLTFGERSRVVAWALTSPQGDALESVCGGVLQAALVEAGENSIDRAVLEILALALAGADEDAPPFAETALGVARAGGWSLREIYDAEAAEIDRLALYLGSTNSPQMDGSWTRIVFAEPGGPADTFGDVRRNLAERLLKRGDPQAARSAHPIGEADVSRAVWDDRPTPNTAHDPILAAIDSRNVAGGDLRDYTSASSESPVSLPDAPTGERTRGYIRARIHPDTLPTRMLSARRLDSDVPTVTEMPRIVPAAPTRMPSARRLDSGVPTVTEMPRTAPAAPTRMPGARRLDSGVSTVTEMPQISLATNTLTANELHTPAGEAAHDGIYQTTPEIGRDTEVSNAFFIDDVGDTLAALLDRESDLRGLDH